VQAVPRKREAVGDTALGVPALAFDIVERERNLVGANCVRPVFGMDMFRIGRQFQYKRFKPSSLSMHPGDCGSSPQ